MEDPTHVLDNLLEAGRSPLIEMNNRVNRKYSENNSANNVSEKIKKSMSI